MSAFIPKGGGFKPSSPLPPAGPPPGVQPATAIEPSFAPASSRIHAARAAGLGAATAAAAGDALPSAFPLHDLGEIPTHGRAAAGFRLDGGALRLMWLTARRVREPTHGDGYELAFFAQGGTINTLEARLKAQGATSGKMQFSARALDPDAPAGRARLVSTKETWGPSQGSSLKLEQPGKFELELVPGEPEALRGAVRLRVYGDDATATKSLQQVVSQLGLQRLFAPPKPADLERFKLFRFLWHFAPEKLEPLRHRSPTLIDDQAIEEAFESAKVPENDPALAAADAADLSEPALAQYLRHLRAFAELAPKAFLSWAKGSAHHTRGLLPAPGLADPSAGLRAAMKTAGLVLDQPAVLTALGESVPAPVARRLLDFGVLLQRSSARATQLCAAEIDQISLDTMRQVAASAGFDPKDPRLQALRFEEVYPGYFTVLDPSLPDRLAEQGARYLYSTAETAERVLELLLEGQKASATRFGEGRLVQGKSSSSDFGTGGAFSVFTRLVTDSAIQKKHSFMNWGGSRPFKVILSRDLLARLDWYGYNGDNFGRTTGLTAAHHGEALVKTIQDSYASSNELMFPVGNAPAFFDFVVCETEAQRKKLLELLAAQGLESFNGKPLEQFVRVEKTFFEHPRDQTLENAVRGALNKLALTEARAQLETKLRAIAEPQLGTWAEAAAQAALQDEAPSAAASIAVKAAQGSAKNAAALAAGQRQDLIPLETLSPKVLAASEAAAQAVLAGLLPGLEKQIPRGPITTIIRSSAKAPAEAAAKAAVEALVAAQLPGLLAQRPNGSPEDQRAWLKAALSALPRDQVRASVEAAILTAAEPAARETASNSVRHHLAKVAGKTARSAAEEQALESARSAALEHGSYQTLRGEIMTAIRPQVSAAAEKALMSSLEKELGAKLTTAARQRVKTQLEAEAAALLPEVEAAVKEALSAVALTAAQSFSQSTGHPFTAAMQAEAQSLAAARTAERAKATVAEQTTKVANALPKAPISAAVSGVLQAALPPLVQGTAAVAVEEVLGGAAEEASERILRKKFGPLAQSAVAAAMEPAQTAAALEWGPAVAAEVLAETAPAMAEYYVDRALSARVKLTLQSL